MPVDITSIVDPLSASLSSSSEQLFRISFISMRCSIYVAYVLNYRGILSSSFLVSPLLFCVNLDGLRKLLKDSQVGCFVGNLCVAAIDYANDLALLAPMARAMRELPNICDVSPLNLTWFLMHPNQNV